MKPMEDPDQAFGGSSQTEKRQNGLHFFNAQSCLRRSLGITQKWLSVVGQASGYF